MTGDVSAIIAGTEEQMKKAITHLEAELIKIRAGKANPQMLDSIVVDYYGSPMPINQVANISILDARTMTIQPFGNGHCMSWSAIIEKTKTCEG